MECILLITTLWSVFRLSLLCGVYSAYHYFMECILYDDQRLELV